MEEDFVKNLINLQLKMKNACEGFEDKNNKPVLITNKLRVLLILNEMGKISPTTLVPMLAIAKSNLNLLCTKMISEKLIERVVDDYDRRIIYYNLTAKGERELNTQIEMISQNLKKYFKFNIDKDVVELAKKINEKWE